MAMERDGVTSSTATNQIPNTLTTQTPTPQWTGLPTYTVEDGTPNNGEGLRCYAGGSKIEGGPIECGYIIENADDTKPIESFGNLTLKKNFFAVHTLVLGTISQ